MGTVELAPLGKFNESMMTYLALNFRRLADALGMLGRVEQTTQTITGTITIDSGIPIVHNVVATLAQAPVASACFVVAALDPAEPRNVIVSVYSETFVLSAVATSVNVVIIGEEPPNRPTRSSG